MGDGAVGEDVGNLVPDAVFDPFLPHELLGELDARLSLAYLAGLREAGFAGDERLVRLGICASAVTYDWLTAHCLANAAADAHPDYGRESTVDAGARCAARAAGIALDYPAPRGASAAGAPTPSHRASTGSRSAARSGLVR